MAGGDKTKACGATAATSFGTMFVDPTPTSAVVFLGSGTSFVVGIAYHGTKKLLRGIRDDMNDHRVRHIPAGPLTTSPSPHIQHQANVEAAFRRLYAAVFGSLINGALCFQLPHFGLAFVFNVKEVFDQSGKLLRLSQQSTTGVAVKFLTTFCFIGNELSDLFNGVSNVAGHLESHPSIPLAVESTAEQIKEGYERITSHHPFSDTTGAASSPVDYMKEAFGGDKENWGWGEKPIQAVVPVAITVAAVDKVQNIVADNRLHAGVDKATRA